MLYSSPLITAYAFVVAALLGLVMGSFINCWAWRYMNGESVLSGRSHCTTCGHVLAVRDLVPLFSWLSTHGKCRYCGERVSARYPATELVLAIAFVAITARYGLSLETVELLAFTGILLFLTLTDLDDYLIPNGCIIAAIAVRVAYLAITFALGQTSLESIGYFVASAFGMGVVMLVIVLIADKVFGRESMGGGDLKLYFVAGLYFGWQQGLFLVILSCVIGIIVAFIAPRNNDNSIDSEGEDLKEVEGVDDSGGIGESEGAKALESIDESANPENPENPERIEDPEDSENQQSPESTLKRMIPFGPSIAAACVITMLVGEPLISWYLGMM